MILGLAVSVGPGHCMSAGAQETRALQTNVPVSHLGSLFNYGFRSNRSGAVGPEILHSQQASKYPDASGPKATP